MDSLAAALGAVEMDPAQVPAHWLTPLPEGQAWAVFLEGRNVERPDWSRKDAREWAKAMLQFRAWLQGQRDLAASRGLPAPHSMPRWHGVAVCDRCHEVQPVQSNITKNNQCWACQGRCQQKHRPNVRACADCRSEVRVIWTTDQDLPGDWHE